MFHLLYMIVKTFFLHCLSNTHKEQAPPTSKKDFTVSYTMKYKLFWSVIIVLLSSGLCHGAGVITADFLQGATGENITFLTSLKPTAEPFMALTWSFNKTIQVITSTSEDMTGQGYEDRVVLNRSTGSLILRNITEKDSGEYELLIIPYGAELIQGTAKLRVQTKISTASIDCPTEHLIEGKTSVNLTCDADGLVTNRIWLKDGKAVVPGDRFSFHHGNRVFSISPTHRTDTGEILCNVSNDISFQTAMCSLKVYYGPDKPIITQKPKRAELEERVKLFCSAQSLPEATLFWTFKGVTISRPEINIPELEEEHLGVYTCTVRNSVTGQEASERHRLRGI
uniref:Carcinoembryonic antigen-related cell adhesion molecule 1-like n=1 Tax=Cynoglossus semilaevis TaxID=244447 RepID=A0A3P8VW15_CYNSE